MASFYPYLISSLPSLLFGMRPPFPYDILLDKCRNFIPVKDFDLLSNLPASDSVSIDNVRQPTVKGWIYFDTALRNELVKLRSVRRHVEAQKYLRSDIYTGPAIAHIALAAQRNPSIQEGEKFLDGERWKALDELSCGHYFDLDALIVYAYKLRILERWELVRLADKKELLEKALTIN